MSESQDTPYEVPAVEDLTVDEGPASVQAGARQISVPQ